MTQPGFKERCARWLLLLTLLHTVPVLWLTPVSGGTAPTAALLAYGAASLLQLDRQSLALALIALVPALIYCGMAWALAWLIAKGLQRASHLLRAGLLAVFTLVPLLAVYRPIYIAGSHNGSRSASLSELFAHTLDPKILLGYWVSLHALLALLYAAHLLPDQNPILRFAERWRRTALATVVIALIAALLYADYPRLVCQPVAALGSSRAALCVARAGGSEQRYWYERAATSGEPEALQWLLNNTPNRTTRLMWLRRGAAMGDAATQFALAEHLRRFGSADGGTEAAQWLRRAADAGHAPAMLALVDELSTVLYRSPSDQLLRERNDWLERAAALGARDAMSRLALHLTDGSMGYDVDLARARNYYLELSSFHEPTANERTLDLNTAFYQARVAEIDAWTEGLDSGDPKVMRARAQQYLRSQLPGPMVRAQGIALLEQLASAGDDAARDELLMLLRTGSGGVTKDLNRARHWLLSAAEAGDTVAMERVVNNSMSGREGFPVDYAVARYWLEQLAHRYTDDEPALRKIRSEVAYIDRLAGQAGEPLLGAQALAELGQRDDAESNYRFALQLLAGHGQQRRSEALARLSRASDQGHADAAWRLFQIYERGFASEIDPVAALGQLRRAHEAHHFEATRELAMRYETGQGGLTRDLRKAIVLYEGALAAGHDNRYGWNLDPDNYNHFKWLESRLRQARLKL